MIGIKSLRLFIHHDGVRLVNCLERDGSIYKVCKKGFFDTLFGKDPQVELLWDNLGEDIIKDVIVLPLRDSHTNIPTGKSVKLTFRDSTTGKVFKPKELDGMDNTAIAWELKAMKDQARNLLMFVHELRKSVNDETSTASALEVLRRIKPKIDAMNVFAGGGSNK